MTDAAEYAWCPRCAGPLVDRVQGGDPRRRRVCARCGHVLYENPRLAAGTLPLREGRIALVRRGVEPGAGLWTWPCGFVEIDETVEDAAVRETREESGLVVTLRRLLGVYSYPIRPGEARSTTNGLIVLAWETDDVRGDLAPGDDAVDAAWFAVAEIPWDALAFDSTRRALRDLLTSPRRRARGPRGLSASPPRAARGTSSRGGPRGA